VEHSPVFHIDLLTPYRETITHGPNYQRPVPELVDGEEEYSVEKILDSRKFGRRRRLQYLVKWEGYPDSDNMWVDKDDVFADDKVREFKASNPTKETHIRSLASAKSPYPSALPHSHLLTLHATNICHPMDDLTLLMKLLLERTLTPPLGTKTQSSTPFTTTSAHGNRTNKPNSQSSGNPI
jgi:hypothetical protein